MAQPGNRPRQRHCSAGLVEATYHAVVTQQVARPRGAHGATPHIHDQGRESRVSLSRKLSGPHGPGRSHIPRRHSPAAPPPALPAEPSAAAQAQHERSLERDVVTLEAMGWHVVELRPRCADSVVLWRVAIERYDKTMTMAISHAADPDSAVAELVRYVQVDVS
ncbi:MAG TPA: hypothetical protein VNO30_06535 [Kofleriaceae bacterium]|nr:hypothetical protein [Kofleriaceae bacterium]